MHFSGGRATNLRKTDCLGEKLVKQRQHTAPRLLVSSLACLVNSNRGQESYAKGEEWVRSDIV